jgi:hypothetical protein
MNEIERTQLNIEIAELIEQLFVYAPNAKLRDTMSVKAEWKMDLCNKVSSMSFSPEKQASIFKWLYRYDGEFQTNKQWRKAFILELRSDL